jgi:hypothetical protein
MFIELNLAFHASISPLDEAPHEPDCDLTLVSVAVMLGHAEGHPMTATEISERIHMPRSSVLTRRADGARPDPAPRGPVLSRTESRRGGAAPRPVHLILAKAFAVYGPCLSKMDE